MRTLTCLLLAAASLLAACGPETPTGANDGASRTTELTLLLFGGPEEVAGYNAMIDAFEATQDRIDVTVSPVPNQDALLARLSTSMAAGSPPDLFLINFRKFGQFAAEGAIQPVQPYLDASDVLSEDDFVEPPLEAFRFDGGNLTCQPQNVSNLVVYVNVDLFAAAGVTVPYEGWTWAEFVAAAKALTTDEIYGLGTDTSIIRLAPFVWSNGGEVVDDLEAPTTLTLDTGPAREAYDFFLDLSLEHHVVPPDAAEQSEGSEARFLRGGLAMYMNSRKSTPTLRTITDFTWDVVPLPVAPGGEPVTMLHSDAYCIADGTGHEDAAWRVIEFAMSEQGQRILMESGRTVPSRIDVLDSPAFLDPEEPPEHSEVFAANARIARATPNTATWLPVEDAVDDLLAAAFYGRMDREAALQQMIAVSRRLFADET